MATEEIERMDVSARAERRQEIAAFVDAGGSRREAAAKFAVSTSLVAMACAEYGTKAGKRELTRLELFKIAAKFILGEKNSEIAEEFEMSRELIRQIRDDAEKAGVFSALQEVAKAIAEKVAKS